MLKIIDGFFVGVGERGGVAMVDKSFGFGAIFGMNIIF